MTGDDQTSDRGLDPGAHRDAAPVPTHPLELALHHGLRYSGLRDVEPDPRLLLYVPLEICERETVLPLSVDEQVLEIAIGVAEPDLAIVHQRFPVLELELVFAPVQRIAELHEALRAVR